MSMAYILAKKYGSTQIWKENRVVPVTIVEALPNTVSLVRTKARDGYQAIQLQLGKRAKREFRVPGEPGKAIGDKLTVAVFNSGDHVKVSGISKGRGFQGVVKRHGFHGGPKTHGQKDRLRAPGSIGSTAPQRVVPGRKMPGQMGNVRVTVSNLEVVSVDTEKNQIFLKGAVPGAKGGLLEIRSAKS